MTQVDCGLGVKPGVEPGVDFDLTKFGLSDRVLAFWPEGKYQVLGKRGEILG